MKNINLIIVGLALLGGALGLETLSYAVQSEKEKEVEWIEENQLISIGERIYYTSRMIAKFGKSVHWYEYYYIGIENNNIKIEKIHYIYEAGSINAENKTILTLPLNVNKQAVFKITPILESEQSGPELLITIVGDFGRIRVEKLDKK